MKTQLLAGAAMLVLMSGTAFAQSTTTETSSSTTVAPAPLMAPPSGVLSTTETKKAVDANGDQYESNKTTYGNANGVTSESKTTTTIQPPPAAIVTKKTTTTSTTN
ncbi:MAG: hypothetical protein POG74_07175 [Acidocella sp.]|nr:hypothetical protein [Acidocella sp.]